MSNKIDYTPVILAQLTDLATRVTQLEAANQALRNNGGFHHAPNGSSYGTAPASTASSGSHFGGATSRVQTSIPLASAAGGFSLGARQPTDNIVPPRKQAHATHAMHAMHTMYTMHGAQTKEYKPLTIQDVLHLNETVTIEVGVGKDHAGNFLQTSCVTTFDGVSLTVTACELVPSLVGMSTTKPGEILYRFIEELKNSGHVKKPFTVAPWRLCFVVRDGKKMSLEDLRGVKN
jgi:hypothetical protein